MTQQEGLQTLINAIKVATKRGAFELEEIGTILQAVKVFTTPVEVKADGGGDPLPPDPTHPGHP